jgi:hypothetical protein
VLILVQSLRRYSNSSMNPVYLINLPLSSCIEGEWDEVMQSIVAMIALAKARRMW